MKPSLTVVLALFLVGCVGCASDKFIRGSGDVGQYVLQKAIVLGGRPVSTNSLPKLTSEWSYFQDKSGVVFRLPRDQFLSVVLFLHQAFGEPSMPVSDLDNGGAAGMYAVKDIGVSIQFGYGIDIGNNKDYTLIVMSHVSYPIKK